MTRQPDFFIIGAPKAGTTALSEYLRGHPEVFFCDPKEPHYFSSDIHSRHRVTQRDAYEALFASAPATARAVGEGSVHYLQSAVAVPRILDYAPQARILVMLRNPVDIAVSWHAEAQYSEFETERSFERAWQTRVVQGQPFTGRGDPQLMDYAAVAAVGSQFDRVRALVPAPQLKVVLFDDFRRDTGAAYRSVLDFLGLPDDGRTDFSPVNERKRVRSHRVMQISHAVAGVKRRLGIRRGLGLLERVNVRQQAGTAVSHDMRAALVHWFDDEIARIEHALQVDLSHWRHTAEVDPA